MKNEEYDNIEYAVRNRGMDVFFDDTLKHIKDPKFVKLMKELHVAYTKIDNYLMQEEKRIRNES